MAKYRRCDGKLSIVGWQSKRFMSGLSFMPSDSAVASGVEFCFNYGESLLFSADTEPMPESSVRKLKRANRDKLVVDQRAKVQSGPADCLRKNV